LGAQGLIKFKIAAFEFVEEEVLGVAGPAGERAPMAAAAAHDFFRACMSTPEYVRVHMSL
jgi:hypothetical protein